MSGTAGKADRFDNIGSRFSISLIVLHRLRVSCSIACLLILPGLVLCQCPGTAFFKQKIEVIYKSSTLSLENQLKECLALEQRMRACNLQKDSSFMFLMQKTGILYFRLSDFSKAIAFTNESIRSAKQCISNQTCNTQALVHNYYNLYYYFDKTAQLKKKYEAIDSFISYALKGSGDFDRVIAPLADITDYLFNKGEYSLSSKDAKLGESIIQKYYHGKDSIGYMVSFISKQANALYFSGNITGAEKLLEGKKLQFEQTGNSRYIGSFYGLLGIINTESKNYVKALAYFQKGYRANLAIRFSQGCAQSLGSIGTTYAKFFKKYDAGLGYCARALAFADDIDSLLILRKTGDIYVLKGEYDKAHYCYQQAYNTVQFGSNETTLLQNSINFPGFNQLQDLLDLATSKGDAYLQQYYRKASDSVLKKALNVYRKADLFLAKIKSEQQLEFASNLVWLSTARNLYEHAIEACYANKNVEDAFYFFEKSRAILLNDQVNEQRWMADKDIVQQANLKKAIIALEKEAANVSSSSAEYLKLQDKLYTAYRELQVLTNSIKQKNPVFYQNYLDTVFITVRQLREKILGHDKTFLEIFSGDSGVYVLYISSREQMFTRINKHLYDSLTASFNSYVTSPVRLNKYFTGFVNVARRLFNVLFQNKVLPGGRLIISPDGVNYPFEALVTNSNDREPDYFVNHYATSYAYSAKYLTNQFAANTNTGNSVLGFAPVQYVSKDLAELAGSEVSLEHINEYFSNATNYIFGKATRNNFLQNFPKYNIVQLYTHAADTGMNSDPVIYFTDSLLHLAELIPYQKPVTQLVVLSACETASGKLYQGEGIFSFNRGFAALGIPAAVSNLWSVDNESTYRITELFYKNLSLGLPTDVALQQAKLAFINTVSSKERKLPYFWAGSILTGKVSIIKTTAGFGWAKYISIAILLVIIAYVVRRLVISRNIVKRRT